MNFTWGQGCLFVIVGAFFITAIQNAGQNPTVLVVMVIGLICIITLMVLSNNNKKKRFRAGLLAQAEQLDRLAKGEFNTDGIVFSAASGETVLIRLSAVALKEYRSNGSSYGGGYAGMSFKVAKGVRANVGGMQGKSTRNPEELTQLDVGEVTFTNQRIVFTGDNMVREWDLDKIVNMQTGDNGVDLELAVSNREKTSVLEALNFPELTPGMAASIAVAWQGGDKKAAMADAKEMADQIRAALAKETAK